MSRLGHAVPVLAVALVWNPFVAIATGGAEEATVCAQGISPDTTRRLFAVLNHPPAEADCEFDGLGTDRTRLDARWSRGGTPLPPISAVPRDCAKHSARRAGGFAVDVPREIEENCPSVRPRIAEFLEQLARETPGGPFGSLGDPLFRGTRALFVGIFVVTLVLLRRGARQRYRLDPGWVVVGIASASAALGVRAALPFSMGNWYAEVMPVSGPPPWMRFGPGYFAFQSLLRDLGLWGPQPLVLSQLLLGATALPLLLGLLWELRIGLAAAAATLVLFVFAPFHARLSATSSEHVLASTLCLGLLLSWLRAVRTGDWMWWALAVLLFPAVCATRVDMAVQASLVWPWPLLRDHVERERGLHGRALWARAAALGMVASVVLAVVYREVVLPSHHPLPEVRGHSMALRLSLPQFWFLATSDPEWISLPAVLLAAVGVPTMALRRPLLLVRVTGTLLVALVALGRVLTTDELLGARYFLFIIPIFLIASGQGFEALLAAAPRRWRAAVAAVGVVGLGVWSGVAARTAYGARYAFEDEYSFLRGALPRLPAGCTVYQVPIRSAGFPRDLDCCLDLGRSPLVLDFPHFHFRTLPDRTAGVFEGADCVAYYESVACQIQDDPGDPSVHERVQGAAEDLQRRCAEVRQVGRFVPVAETTTSARATVDFFHGRRPHAGLYRWTLAPDRAP